MATRDDPWRRQIPPHADALREATDGINRRELEIILSRSDTELDETLSTWRLLASTIPTCDQCGHRTLKEKSKNHFRFRCVSRVCRKQSTPQKGTFFERSSIPKRTILRFFYSFCRGEYHIENLRHELREESGRTLSCQTIVEYLK